MTENHKPTSEQLEKGIANCDRLITALMKMQNLGLVTISDAVNQVKETRQRFQSHLNGTSEVNPKELDFF